MNYQSNILLNGRGRGRGQRLPATSLSSHTFESEQKIESPLVNPFDINNNLQNEIIKIKNEINMQKQFNDKYHVRNSQQQFKDDDDSEDDLCKICERIGGNLICKTCGHIWKVFRFLTKNCNKI